MTDPREAERRERHTRRTGPLAWGLIALVAILIFMALMALLIGVQAAIRP